ncbi:HK97 gp10 family phage protein [Streptomyces sp. or3]|uniref:HK97 gp10 family phage protein n=1 Tax=Streptomyces sp. or3 TaxID=1828020 RepID=UPI000BFC055B|nr:HK97 gp10 family phage protein [Streptomyces sp. or3]
MATSDSFTMDARQFERGLRRWVGRLSTESKRAGERTGKRVQNEARRRAPVDSGRLRSSIVSRPEDRGRTYEITVGTNVVYARAIEEGREEMDIFPRTKKALYWPGAVHPVAKVHVPEIPARPYLAPAMAMAETFLREELARAGRRVR